MFFKVNSQSLEPRNSPVFFFVSRITPIGGAERQALYFAKMIQENGHPVAILAREVDEAHLASCAAGIVVRRDIVRALREAHRPVLVSFLAADHAFCAALKASGIVNFRWVAFERTHPDYYWSDLPGSSGPLLRLKRAGLQAAYSRLVDSIFVQTHDAAAGWRRILGGDKPKSIKVIPNAFKIPSACANIVDARQRPLRLVMVGRLTAVKDYPFAFRVAAMLRDRGLPFELTVIGEGELRSTFEDQVRDLAITGYVHFAGLVRDAGAALTGYDLFMMTSRIEGMPNALGEAMASGLPCLTLDFHAGPRELLGVENPEGRYQILHERDVQAFVDRLCEFAADWGLRARLGRYNRKRIEDEFSAARVYELLNAAISDLIDE